MKKVLFTLFFFFVTYSTAFSQTVIYGQVINKESGDPIPDVNVFLSKTTLGTKTDENGTFSIDGIPDGLYNLVFSFVGFEKEVKKVQFFEPDSVYYKVPLSRANIKMENIEVVTERNPEREEDLELFKREFIGPSQNAKNTVIVNPEVLNFEWNDEQTIFTASAAKELHIINHFLGYEIFLTLEEFTIKTTQHFNNYSYRDIISYVCYPRYEEMETIYVTQKDKWIENRRETYKGSKRHFMYTLYHSNFSNEAFDINHGSIDQISEKKKEYLMLHKLLSPDYKKKIKGFLYDVYPNKTRGMVISYGWGNESYLFPAKSNFFFIDEYGNLVSKKSFVTGGDWYNERLADALPLNYKPVIND